MCWERLQLSLRLLFPFNDSNIHRCDGELDKSGVTHRLHSVTLCHGSYPSAGAPAHTDLASTREAERRDRNDPGNASHWIQTKTLQWGTREIRPVFLGLKMARSGYFSRLDLFVVLPLAYRSYDSFHG